MGYTHYFNFEKSTNQFPKNVLSDLEFIGNKYKDIIVIDILSDECISLNGIEPNDYETFYLEPCTTEFNFCKTAREPYDLPVCEMLLVLKHYYRNNFKLESDGFSVSKENFKKKILDGNWGQAIKNIKEQFGYAFNFLPEISNSNGYQYYCFNIE